MMKYVYKIADCPFCKTKGSEILIQSQFDKGYREKHEDRFIAWLECPECLCSGPLAYSRKDDETARNNAKRIWNKCSKIK